MDGKKTCWVSALRVLWAGLSIPICIASLPAVVVHPMAPAGFPAGLVSFCPCACYSSFPPSVPERSGKSLRLRQAPFLRLTREVQLRYPHEFRCYIAPLYETEWAVYAKPPFCGTSTSARLRGPLRASRGDFQQSSTGHRTRPGRVSMEGLPSQRQTKEDDLAVAIPLVAFIVALYECGPLVI